MNPANPLTLGLCLFGLALSTNFAEAPRRLADWYAAEPPAEGSEAHHHANWDSARNYVVAIDDGHAVASMKASPKVEPKVPDAIAEAIGPPSSKATRHAVEVVDGWLVATNAGEFGGRVDWYSPDGKQHRRVEERNVSGFLKTDAGLLELEGIAHLGTNRGSLRRVEKGEGGRWTTEPLVDLEGSPVAATLVGPDTLVVVAADRLVRVDLKAAKAEVLVDKAFWRGLDPNSIAVDPSGAAFVGMRHGVARLDGLKPGPKIQWLLPSKATLDEKIHPSFR